MLQFRAHWLGQETKKQFAEDVDACLWLTKFTHLFFIARILNTDLAHIDALPPLDAVRFHFDQYRKHGATLDQLRAVQSEILADVLLLIDTAASVKDRDEWLLAIVQKVNAMGLLAKWELESALPHKIWFKFPPWSTVSKGRNGVLQEFREKLMVLGPAWGVKNAPKDVQVVRTKNPNLSGLGRGEGVLEIHGGRWIVKRSFIAAIDIRRDIYSSLIRSLEDGSFSRLGRCGHCSLFFIDGEYGKQRYCSKQCSREFTNADGKYRARKSRKKQEERRRQKEAEVYWDKLRWAVDRDRTGKLVAIYKRLGGPQEGQKIIRTLTGKSWSDLSQEIQTKISEISKDHAL